MRFFRISVKCPFRVCAVQRRRFPVGASPTRQPLRPEAIGAVMEVTKWLKPSVMRLRRAGSSRFRLTDRNLRPTAILHLRKPLVRAWLPRVRWYSRRQLALLDLARGGISWFEFIVFRRDIVVGSLFAGHQFLGKPAPKIRPRRFHQPAHRAF